METVDRLFQYRNAFQKARVFLTPEKRGKLSIDDLKSLTTIARTLRGLDYEHDIKLDIEDSRMMVAEKSLSELLKQISTECDCFCMEYSANKNDLDIQCDIQCLYEKIELSNNYKLSFDVLKKDRDRWRDIERKCNDITRLHGSMEVRPMQKREECENIIKKYLEELSDMLGYKVELKTVEEEKHKAKKKISEIDKQFYETEQKRIDAGARELNQVDANVLAEIYCSANKVLSSIQTATINKKNASSQKKKNNCGPKTGKYNKLSDFITTPEIYDKVVNAIKQYTASHKPVEGSDAYFLLCLLRSRQYTNSAGCSEEHFGDLLLKDLGPMLNFKTGRAVSDGKKSEPNPAFKITIIGILPTE